MASRADFYLDVFGGGTGVYYVSAGTGNGDLMVFGVYFSFHVEAILPRFSAK